MPGHFIVLDGPDGSGTTTQSEFLAERLRAEGHEVLLTSEPTDGEIGKAIRGFLKTGKLPPDALQLMFTADRADHVEKAIRPAMHAGKTVICDRYIPSTIIYGQLAGIPSSWLESMNTLFVQPECTLFTLPSLEVCMRRLAKREEKDLFETEEQQRKLHILYRAFAAQHPEITLIDTDGEKDATASLVLKIVKEKLV